MILIYNIFIQAYVLLIRIASFWNPKAKQWLQGRSEVFTRLRSEMGVLDRVVWMHCSSAGEFEQGKPVIEALSSLYPAHRILVTFFSPSGYAAAKKYSGNIVYSYLPVDTANNAHRFIDMVRPEMVVFIKYEFWYHHLAAAAFRHIPIILVSAIFRRKQPFFRWYGKIFRQMLFLFRHIFVQDERSAELLRSFNISHCSVGGDTRFDRVLKVASETQAVDFIEDAVAGSRCIVAGSTWPKDEELLHQAWKKVREIGVKMIITPHEIHQPHLKDLAAIFPGAVFYSAQVREGLAPAKVIVIDAMGLLSRLYRYATIAYVGGGFGAGIHNTLEAAVYGKPVIFGPNYGKFKEANELIASGAAFSVRDEKELETLLARLLGNEQEWQKASKAARQYVLSNAGATERLIQHIQAKRLLIR